MTCFLSRSKQVFRSTIHWRESSSDVGAEIAEIVACSCWWSSGVSWYISLFNSSHEHVLMIISSSLTGFFVFGICPDGLTSGQVHSLLASSALFSWLLMVAISCEGTIFIFTSYSSPPDIPSV